MSLEPFTGGHTTLGVHVLKDYQMSFEHFIDWQMSLRRFKDWHMSLEL